MAEERKGRGRLDSFDLMPEDGQEDLAWAMTELNKRVRPQSVILEELNGRLADKNLPLISKSAFNRKSIRVSTASRRLSKHAPFLPASPTSSRRAMSMKATSSSAK